MKQTQEQMGWLSDDAGEFDKTNKHDNQGFIQRAKWFCEHPKGNDSGEEWQFKAKPIRFSAPIDHDMASLATGLPPGTTTQLTFIQTSDKFRILTSENPDVPYSLEIKDIMLLIPT